MDKASELYERAYLLFCKGLGSKFGLEEAVWSIRLDVWDEMLMSKKRLSAISNPFEPEATKLFGVPVALVRGSGATEMELKLKPDDGRRYYSLAERDGRLWLEEEYLFPITG